MWRVPAAKALACRTSQLQAPEKARYLAVCRIPCRTYADVRQPKDVKPLEPPPEEGGPPPRSSAKTGLLIAAGALTVTMGTLYANDNARFWFIDQFPSTKGVFASLGCNVEREPLPCTPCNKADIERIIGKPKQPCEKVSSTSTSVIDVADKSVSALNINQALTNDMEKKTEITLKALNKQCKTEEKTSTAPVSAAKAASAEENIKKLQEKQFAAGEGSRVQKAAHDSAKLLLTNLRSPSPDELESRQKKEEKKHEERMLERSRRDEKYLKQQQEQMERKAALDLEKQKKEEAEQEALAEAALNKIRKNQEFETEAAKKLSQVHEVANTAMIANGIAIATSREHNSKLREAMDVTLEEEALKLWPDVQKLNEVRLEQVKEAHRVQLLAEVAIVDYLKFIDAAKKDGSTKDNCSIPTFRKQIQEIAFDVKTVHDKLKSQEQVSSIMKHYYHMMKKDKADFLKELEAIVPEVKLGEKGLNLSEEELNALLAHAHRRIFQLKKQLREQQMQEHQRLEDALCEQKKQDMKEANIKIGQELDKQYQDLMLEREAELLGHNRNYDSELKLSLAKQASEHHDHLQDMLALQQKKLMEQFDLALRERLIHERHVFIDLMAKSLARVKGLEAALEERADLELVITHVQDLMSGALCLMHAVAHDVDCDGEEYDRVRIDEPLRRCFRAAEMHPFAQAVLHSIPDKAVEKGIYTISSLERRFYSFYNKSIGEAASDSSVGVFRRLWNKLAFSAKPELSPKYLEACDFDDPENMTAEELMVQAKYFMDKKCLPEVVRCIVQLSGATREMAQDWLEEARLVLEVRQATEVLMAYANSKGMGTIF